jgi:hypothetical protein
MVKKQPTLIELQGSIQKLASEVRKLRLEINYKKRPKPQQATITNPEWCYEYPSMTVDLTVEQWKDIRNGKKITIKGRGYTIKEFNSDGSDLYEQDYWFFNEKYQGHIRVEIGQESVSYLKEIAYDGALSDCEIIESEPPKKTKKRSSTKKM